MATVVVYFAFYAIFASHLSKALTVALCVLAILFFFWYIRFSAQSLYKAYSLAVNRLLTSGKHAGSVVLEDADNWEENYFGMLRAIKARGGSFLFIYIGFIGSVALGHVLMYWFDNRLLISLAASFTFLQIIHFGRVIST